MFPLRDNRFLSASRGIIALVLVLLVVALGALSVRPDWHATMHELLNASSNHWENCDTEQNDAQPDTEAGCAVELYGSEGLQIVVSTLSCKFVSAEVLRCTPVQSLNPRWGGVQYLPPGRAPPFFII